MTGQTPQGAGLAELFRKAWAERSPPERDAFVAGLKENTAPATDVFAPSEETLRRIRSRAALSGSVRPYDLISDLDLDDDERGAAVNAVAAAFDRSLVGKQWRWTLRTSARREALNELSKSGKLSAALKDAKSIETDEPGLVLRHLIAGGRVPPLEFHDVDRRRRELQTVLQALAWAELLRRRPERVELRRQATLTSTIAGSRRLARGFVGRVRELRELRRFAAQAVQTGGVPVLPVIGVGELGKSALIAKLIDPLLERCRIDPRSGPAVVLIDFDRVQFRVGAEVELSFEVTRQLALAEPKSTRAFVALRERTRRTRRDLGEEFASEAGAVESAYRSTDTFSFNASNIVRKHGLDQRPALLILDTFEEWQRTRPIPAAPREVWNDPSQRILEWVATLREKMGLSELRVIVSGRGPVETRISSIKAWPPLNLKELSAAQARTMLRRLHLPSEAIARLAQIAGGSPLALRLAGRYFFALDPDKRDEFLADKLGVTDELDAGLRQGILYDRFLRHIPDEDLRQLAHPGLVLRRVTPVLIRDVLAAPCDLKEVDDLRARDLFDRLSDEVWLVDYDGSALWHRRDVRRVMLRMMTTDNSFAQKAREIHTTAAVWYENGHDSAFGPELSAAEALYHHLMLLPDGAVLSDEQRDASIKWFLPDTSDFAPGVAAQILFHAGERVPEELGVRLPEPKFSEWLDMRGAELVDGGATERALGLLDSRRTIGQVREPVWMAQAFLDSVRWEQYRPEKEKLSDGLPRDRGFRLETGKHRVLLTFFTGERRPGDPNYLVAAENALEARPKPRPKELLDLLFFASIAANPARFSRVSILRQHEIDHPNVPGLVGNDQLRRIFLLRLAGLQPVVMLSGKTLPGIFRPDPQWVSDFSSAVVGSVNGHFKRDLERFADRLRNGAEMRADAAADAGSFASSAILGTWATEFASAAGGHVSFDPRLLTGQRLLLLRGNDPELRPMIWRALAEAFPGADDFRKLDTILATILAVLPTDFKSRTLAIDGARRPQEVRIRLVEYVDRCGRMRALLDRAHEVRPDAPTLEKVRAAFMMWDDACIQALEGRTSTAPAA